MHEKSVINIEWLVKNIEQLMANHSPIEAMYTDVFQSFDIDIPVESNAGISILSGLFLASARKRDHSFRTHTALKYIRLVGLRKAHCAPKWI